jgi:two-component system chemotaxis response regulator CheY
MLIIDDSKAMRSFLVHIAHELSFTTTEAEDGRAGLETLLKNDPNLPFDIVLVDWDMPVMNGIEFIECVRKNRDYAALKILMVTTNNTVEKITQAIKAGASEFLMKPVTQRSLAEKLQLLGIPAGPSNQSQAA